MQVFHPREPAPADPAEQADDPLARFRSWRGFLFAAVAVNLLFVYGMLNNTADPSVAIWFKVLVWLPFNAIASALYLVFMIKLGKANAANNQTGGPFYVALCSALIGANWIAMFAA